MTRFEKLMFVFIGLQGLSVILAICTLILIIMR